MKEFISFFIQGGPAGMAVITFIFVLVFLAAWKAPAWVKNIGQLALAAGFIWTLLGIFQMLSYLGQNPDTAARVIFSGIKVSLIPLIYSSFIFVIALIINTIQKPRIQ